MTNAKNLVLGTVVLSMMASVIGPKFNRRQGWGTVSWDFTMVTTKASTEGKMYAIENTECDLSDFGRRTKGEEEKVLSSCPNAEPSYRALFHFEQEDIYMTNNETIMAQNDEIISAFKNEDVNDFFLEQAIQQGTEDVTQYKHYNNEDFSPAWKKDRRIKLEDGTKISLFNIRSPGIPIPITARKVSRRSLGWWSSGFARLKSAGLAVAEAAYTWSNMDDLVDAVADALGPIVDYVMEWLAENSCFVHNLTILVNALDCALTFIPGGAAVRMAGKVAAKAAKKSVVKAVQKKVAMSTGRFARHGDEAAEATHDASVELSRFGKMKQWGKDVYTSEMDFGVIQKSPAQIVSDFNDGYASYKDFEKTPEGIIVTGILKDTGNYAVQQTFFEDEANQDSSAEAQEFFQESVFDNAVAGGQAYASAAANLLIGGCINAIKGITNPPDECAGPTANSVIMHFKCRPDVYGTRERCFWGIGDDTHKTYSASNSGLRDQQGLNTGFQKYTDATLQSVVDWCQESFESYWLSQGCCWNPQHGGHTGYGRSLQNDSTRCDDRRNLGSDTACDCDCTAEDLEDGFTSWRAPGTGGDWSDMSYTDYHMMKNGGDGNGDASGMYRAPYGGGWGGGWRRNVDGLNGHSVWQSYNDYTQDNGKCKGFYLESLHNNAHEVAEEMAITPAPTPATSGKCGGMGGWRRVLVDGQWTKEWRNTC